MIEIYKIHYDVKIFVLGKYRLIIVMLIIATALLMLNNALQDELYTTYMINTQSLSGTGTSRGNPFLHFVYIDFLSITFFYFVSLFLSFLINGLIVFGLLFFFLSTHQGTLKYGCELYGFDHYLCL